MHKTVHSAILDGVQNNFTEKLLNDSAKKYDLIVIGSGPAGLAGAFFYAVRGKKVLLLEKEKRFGGKLPISGGARCNVTNILSADEQARAFGKKSRFLLPALKNFPPQMTRDFFKAHGVPIEVTDGFHCFPVSGKAADLVDALLNCCQDQYVECLNNTRADELLIENRKIYGVRCGNKNFFADNVLLACGGKSYPKWSGSESGYSLARQAGHSVTALYPAMTGLQCVEEWVGTCAGISLENAECAIDMPGEKLSCRGELLFTHQGISAFAVLDLAGRTAQLLDEQQTVPLKINLFASVSRAEWQNRLARQRQTNGKLSIGKIMAEYLPRKIVQQLVPAPETPIARYTGTETKILLDNLTSLKLHAKAAENWHKAMVTKGGVPLDEVNSKTLESRIVSGLYFAGELLDVDGPCGGYNIQWALSSGALCGQKINSSN